MSEPMVMERRDVLRLLATFAASAALPTMSHGAAGLTGGRTRARVLASHLGDVRTAAAVGERYLRTKPGERDATRLAELLGLPAAPLDALPPDRMTDVLRALITRHRDDFRHGRTRQIRGWVLTTTELRLYALVHLATRNEADES